MKRKRTITAVETPYSNEVKEGELYIDINENTGKIKTLAKRQGDQFIDQIEGTNISRKLDSIFPELESTFSSENLKEFYNKFSLYIPHLAKNIEVPENGILHLTNSFAEEADLYPTLFNFVNKVIINKNGSIDIRDKSGSININDLWINANSENAFKKVKTLNNQAVFNTITIVDNIVSNKFNNSVPSEDWNALYLHRSTVKEINIIGDQLPLVPNAFPIIDADNNTKDSLTINFIGKLPQGTNRLFTSVNDKDRSLFTVAQSGSEINSVVIDFSQIPNHIPEELNSIMTSCIRDNTGGIKNLSIINTKWAHSSNYVHFKFPSAPISCINLITPIRCCKSELASNKGLILPWMPYVQYLYIDSFPFLYDCDIEGGPISELNTRFDFSYCPWVEGLKYSIIEKGHHVSYPVEILLSDISLATLTDTDIQSIRNKGYTIVNEIVSTNLMIGDFD